MANKLYHYTESGLKNVYLADGFEYRTTTSGRTLFIQDIGGLHKAIGRFLIGSPAPLSGDEFRYLRTELLLSQRTLAKLIGVAELTVARWEKGTPIPRATDALIRQIYAEHIGAKSRLGQILERIADLEDEIDTIQKSMKMRDTPKGWTSDAMAA